jgi:hypothetical protein
MKACYKIVVPVISLLGLFSCNSFKKNEHEKGAGDIKVFQTIPYQNPDIIKVTPNYKSYVLGIHEKDFLVNEKVDSLLLIKTLSTLYPKANDSGMACLDWEGEVFQYLIKQDDNQKFKYYLKEYIKSIRIAKRFRPNVQWGYYNLPFREYWKPNSDWEEKNNNLLPLYKEFDFLAPSMYTFYLEKEHPGQNEKSIKANMEYFLKLSKELKIPLYPFVWQRFHTANKKFRYDYIPLDQFSTELSLIVSAEYEGKKTDGIIWWNSGINSLNELSVRNEKNDSIKEDFLKRPQYYKVYKKEVDKVLNNKKQ